MLLLLAEDAETVQSSELPWGGHFVGREGFRQFYDTWVKHVEVRLEFEQAIDAGDHIVAVGRSIGKARGTQLEFEVPIVHVWTFRGGQVVRLEAYTDNATLLAALGA